MTLISSSVKTSSFNGTNGPTSTSMPVVSITLMRPFNFTSVTSPLQRSGLSLWATLSPLLNLIILKALNVNTCCYCHHYPQDDNDDSEVDVSVIVFHCYNIPHKGVFVKGFFKESYPQTVNKFSTSGMERAARRVPVVKGKVIHKLLPIHPNARAPRAH